ncbi:MAG: hypothetical protein HOY69_20745 [Streptomyces sp.]|nr:hypothetical protein [Streptomyces sp.]
MPPTLPPPPAAGGQGEPLTESIVLPRFIARAAARDRTEAQSLVRAAGLPAVLSAPDTARSTSSGIFRLWREVLDRTGRQDAGLLAATQYRHGQFDLFDYLVSTAPTLGEGLALATTHLHLLSGDSTLSTEVLGDEVTVTYGVRPNTELSWVAAEFVIAALTEQIRHCTGEAISPSRVTFAHEAPPRTADYADHFGAARLDFGTGANTLTLHRRELEMPMATADPALAAIIRRNAAAFPPPRPDVPGVVPGLRGAILAQLADGRPSLAATARRLAVSPRTLQRRLAEADTTWREELDAVRRDFSTGLRRSGTWSTQRAAARLGFAEPRSLRRAMHRWDLRDAQRAAEGGEEPRPQGAAGPTEEGTREA